MSEEDLVRRPGDALMFDFLRPLGLTQTALAGHMNVSRRVVHEIVHGKRRITPRLAWALAGALETTPQFWLALQTEYDLQINRPVSHTPSMLKTANRRRSPRDRRLAFTIRPAVAVDVALIHALHSASVRALSSSHYTTAEIEAWLHGRTADRYLPAISRGEMFVAVRTGRLAGFGHATPGAIQAIFVHPDYAGEGVGRLLLACGMQIASDGYDGPVELEATLNAVPFYERSGFETLREIAAPVGDEFIRLMLMVYRPRRKPRAISVISTSHEKL